METKCKNCENKEACVPFFEHEGSMEHMKFAIRAVVGIAALFAISMLTAIIIFVSSYNSRTKEWLSTYSTLQNRGVVTSGIYEQSSP